MCMCYRQLGVASRLWWNDSTVHLLYCTVLAHVYCTHVYTCCTPTVLMREQAVLQRFDRSAAAVQREFDVERSEIAAVRLKRAQHVDRRRRLGTAAALAPPQLAGSWMTSGARPATAP